MRGLSQSLCVLVAISGWAMAARADAIENFYKGRQIKLVIGSNTGGAYDSYGRLLAAHLGRHIPGNPTVVPSNMPGASGIQSATYLYQIAPKDGSALGLFNQSMGQRQMLEPDAVRFDTASFNWLGAMNTTTNVFITWHASGVKTLDDAKTKDVVMGALSSDGEILSIRSSSTSSSAHVSRSCSDIRGAIRFSSRWNAVKWTDAPPSSGRA